MATAKKEAGQVTLTLTEDEAATLLYIVGFGGPGGERGQHTGSVYAALDSVDVEDLYETHGHDLFLDGTPSLRFKD